MARVIRRPGKADKMTDRVVAKPGRTPQAHHRKAAQTTKKIVTGR